MKAKIFSNTILTIISSLATAEVDLVSGGYVHRLDLAMDQTVLRLEFRSRSTWITNLGFGWCGPWTAQLIRLPERNYGFNDCESRQVFYPETSGTGFGVRYRSAKGSELRIDPQGSWVFKETGERLKFDSQGLLVERWAEAEVEKFQYDALKRLRLWQSPWGEFQFHYLGISLQMNRLTAKDKEIRFKYKNEDLVAVLTGERRFFFEYDEFHNLTVVRDGSQIKHRIQYESEADTVRTYQNARGCVSEYSFTNRRVKARRQCPLEEETATTTRIEFSKIDKVAKLKKVNRTKDTNSVEYIFGRDNRLAAINSPQLGTVRFQYDTAGNLLKVEGIENKQTLELANEAL